MAARPKPSFFMMNVYAARAGRLPRGVQVPGTLGRDTSAHMVGKTPADSRTETTHFVLPEATNALGTIFGGTIMQWIDEVAAIAATRHAGGIAVTAAVDALQFLAPIHLGDLVVLKAQVNAVGRTSMEVGVRVEVEDPKTGVRKKTTKAYLTFVATDDDGRPRDVA